MNPFSFKYSSCILYLLQKRSGSFELSLCEFARRTALCKSTSLLNFLTIHGNVSIPTFLPAILLLCPLTMVYFPFSIPKSVTSIGSVNPFSCIDTSKSSVCVISSPFFSKSNRFSSAISFTCTIFAFSPLAFATALICFMLPAFPKFFAIIFPHFLSLRLITSLYYYSISYRT